MNKYRHLLTLGVLFLLVFVLFGKTLTHRFNSDDYLVIYHALRDSAAEASDGLKEFVRPSWGLYYRPGIKFFFGVLAALFNQSPEGYHLTSLVCYALLCFQVYYIALQLGAPWHAAFAAAIIFLTANVHAEALFWISSLNGVVENICTFAALISYIAWRKTGSIPFYASALLLFGAALLTKESAVSLPVVLILYELLLRERASWRTAAKEAVKHTAPFVLLTVSFVFVRHTVMRHVNLPPPLVTLSLESVVSGSWHSFLMTLSPIDWTVVTQWFGQASKMGLPFHLPAGIAFLAIVLLPLVLNKPRICFLLVWIVVGSAPVLILGLVPSERHVVFSSVAGAILVALGLFKVSEKIFPSRNGPAVLVGFLLTVLFAGTSAYYLKKKQGAWRFASLVTSAIIEQTVEKYEPSRSNTTFFYFNVPDSVEGALIFRFDNLTYALRLAYADDSVKAIQIVTIRMIAPDVSSHFGTAYFKIAALGGNIYAPEHLLEDEEIRKRWDRLGELNVLEKNETFLRDWEQYEDSPFFVYFRGELIPVPSAKLESVLHSLYSLNPPAHSVF